jgi:hypothetical protein
VRESIKADCGDETRSYFNGERRPLSASRQCHSVDPCGFHDANRGTPPNSTSTTSSRTRSTSSSPSPCHRRHRSENARLKTPKCRPDHRVFRRDSVAHVNCPPASSPLSFLRQQNRRLQCIHSLRLNLSNRLLPQSCHCHMLKHRRLPVSPIFIYHPNRLIEPLTDTPARRSFDQS